MSMEKLGAFLRRLREAKGASLREVEDKTGVNNALIFQIESGERKHLPSASVLGRLATYYNVSMSELLGQAGYLQKSDVGETDEQKIERAFVHATSDPEFAFGTRLDGDLDTSTKRYIIELYEKVTGRKILGEPSEIRHHSTSKRRARSKP